jgi:N,N'-diacetyllegionaminate synthase
MGLTPYFIAEAGVNHNGSFDEALRLIDAAEECGADAVKFQMFDYRLLKNPALRPLQLGKEALADLHGYARSKQIDFLCTPFDVNALEWLAQRRLRYMKLSSGSIFNKDMLKAANDCGLPVILSTGMATHEEVRDAVEICRNVVCLLHCTSAYPAPIESANLLAMKTLEDDQVCSVGYSDHTANPDVLYAAAAMGAKIIEAHITRDRNQAGPDHGASYEPQELKLAITRIRLLGKIMGTGVKAPQSCEMPCREAWAA